MARQKLSEYRAKIMLAAATDRTYTGRSVNILEDITSQLDGLDDAVRYVVKVDQGIKRRMKQGLVRLDRSVQEVADDLAWFREQGYAYCLVEPMLAHAAESERYVSFEQTRDGICINYALAGGIEIESVADAVHRVPADDDGMAEAAEALGVPIVFLSRLHHLFIDSYATLLEINPLVVNDAAVTALDVAMEVDGEAAYLTRDMWSVADVRSYRKLTVEEKAVEELAATSRASLRFEVIHPDGAIWLLLSGGGASIVVADEVNNHGYGSLLGNYGEYSGNPNEAETFGYTTQLLRALLNSKAERKVLVIAGAVANFTDVRATFRGVIRAIETVADEMAAQGVRVFARRGGPYQTEGLALLHDCLQKHGLLGSVDGPDLPLADSVSAALKLVEKPA